MKTIVIIHCIQFFFAAFSGEKSFTTHFPHRNPFFFRTSCCSLLISKLDFDSKCTGQAWKSMMDDWNPGIPRNLNSRLCSFQCRWLRRDMANAEQKCGHLVHEKRLSVSCNRRRAGGGGGGGHKLQEYLKTVTLIRQELLFCLVFT